MKVFYECELVAIIPVEFTSGVGETVSYNELYFVNEEDSGSKQMLKFNSKMGVATLAVPSKVLVEVDFDSTGKSKPKLLSVKNR